MYSDPYLTIKDIAVPTLKLHRTQPVKKTRTAHDCTRCGRKIMIGSSAVKCVEIYDDGVSVRYEHSPNHCPVGD